MNQTRCNSKSKWKEAEEYGIDLSIIDSNLRMTPTERLIAHQAALETVSCFREAGRAYYARQSKTNKTSGR